MREKLFKQINIFIPSQKEREAFMGMTVKEAMNYVIGLSYCIQCCKFVNPVKINEVLKICPDCRFKI